LKEGKGAELKENLVEHFDFVAVSCEVWRHLYSWYSSDMTVVRFMKRDKINKKIFYLELYPEKQKLEKHIDENNSEAYESESENEIN
jgi:hypothetical protein